ncbi:MAG: DUF3990 domain-containing protein [Prevotellaceae bacterium]|jgi:hypothetical protein|nr:DUF3990 domain-containing protein [Prevotellaceae bacterium]
MKLYHGSFTPDIKQPDLSKCRQKTDFGKGFYTTKSFEQAEKWAILRKNRFRAEKACVIEYEIDDIILSSGEYKIKHFDGATKEWLEFVFNNRKYLAAETYDMVMGPVANDSLYATLLLYEQGVLSVDATIAQLKTYTLFDQLSFHTSKAIGTLRFVKTIYAG